MARTYYSTGQLARKASVTRRTLRHYDQLGLLSPSQHTEAGYRLYTDTDLLILQQILALKFLGFSLEEVRHCLRRGPRELSAILARQRQILQEKRRQIDRVLAAIARTEAELESGRFGNESILQVIEVIRMEQTKEWVQQYFDDAQLARLNELSQSAYSEEAQRKLAQHGEWTEDDQRRANEQWAYVAAEADRLAAAGADPAGDEAQALAAFKSELLAAFTQGDPDIEAGLSRFWERHNALRPEEQPLANVVPASSQPGADTPGARLLQQAMEIYHQQSG